MPSQTTWRALRSELLRSTAPVAAVATLVAGAAMLYSEATSWAGQWMTFAASVRLSMFIVGAVAVAAGAWQAGREWRRHTGDQLEMTARPRWHPIVIAWVAVTIGCWLGLVGAVVAGAALVAPVASYSGGGWWWLIAVAFVAVAAMSALGVALGTFIRSRLTAPVAFIAVYAIQVYAHDSAFSLGDVVWLAPVVAVHDSFGSTLGLEVHLQQTLWFGALAATMLVLAGARRRGAALVPAAVAAVGAALLVTGPNAQGFTKWEFDPAATESVCTDDLPEVCLPRVEAFLLDDVTPHAREVLARFDGIPGGPVRAANIIGPAPTDSEGQIAEIETGRITITGHLYSGEDWSPIRWQPHIDCEIGPSRPGTWLPFDVASMWAIDNDGIWGDPRTVQAWNALRGMPMADQKAWIADLIAAAESCDQDVLSELADQLT